MTEAGVASRCCACLTARVTVPIRPQRRCLNLRAAKKADDNIRPRFVIRVQVRTARLCGGGCGAVDGAHAYLSIPTLIAGLPAGTGTALAREVLAILRGLGGRSISAPGRRGGFVKGLAVASPTGLCAGSGRGSPPTGGRSTTIW